MKKNFIISWKIYPFDVMVSIGEKHEDLVKIIEKFKYKLDKKEKEKLWMTGVGRTVMLKGGQTIIRLDTRERSTIAHEVFHAVDFLLAKIDTPLIPGTEEVYAYAIQYLTKEIYKNLKIPLK